MLDGLRVYDILTSMSHDPRTAPPPEFSEFEEIIHSIAQGTSRPAETERILRQHYVEQQINQRLREQSFEEHRLEVEKSMQQAQNLANQNNVGISGTAVATNNSGPLLFGHVAAVPIPQFGQGFMPAGKEWQLADSDDINILQKGIEGDNAQMDALGHMNPIAREKFEPLFKLLDIKIRFSRMPWGKARKWVIAKVPPGELPIRMEWTAPENDPGCALATWDAMVSELLDEVAHRARVETAIPNSAHPPIPGQQP